MRMPGLQKRRTHKLSSKITVGLAVKLADVFVRYPKVFFGLAIAYLILPVDLIPEAFIGPVGYIDDLVVLMLPFLLKGYAKRYLERNQDKKDSFDTTARPMNPR